MAFQIQILSSLFLLITSKNNKLSRQLKYITKYKCKLKLCLYTVSYKSGKCSNFADTFCQGYRKQELIHFCWGNKMIPPYVREFGNVHMHVPFYTDTEFQEIDPKIHWQKF